MQPFGQALHDILKKLAEKKKDFNSLSQIFVCNYIIITPHTTTFACLWITTLKLNDFEKI